MSADLSTREAAAVRRFGIFAPEERRSLYIDAAVEAYEADRGIVLTEWPLLHRTVMRRLYGVDDAGLEAVERALRSQISTQLRILEREARDELDMIRANIDDAPTSDLIALEASIAAYATAVDVAEGVAL